MDAFGMRRQQREIDLANALGLPFPIEPHHAACRDQPAEAAISRAVCGIGEEGEALGGLDPAADHRAHAQRPGLAVDAHHAGH